MSEAEENHIKQETGFLSEEDIADTTHLACTDDDMVDYVEKKVKDEVVEDANSFHLQTCKGDISIRRENQTNSTCSSASDHCQTLPKLQITLTPIELSGYELQKKGYGVWVTSQIFKPGCSLAKSPDETKTNSRDLRRKAKEKQSFICAYCNKKFQVQSGLTRHLRMHTGERPYECFICQKKFPQASHLKSHIAVHIGQKSFPCSICKRSFTYRNKLQKHLQRMAGRKHYSCLRCGFSFVDKSKFQDHVKKHEESVKRPAHTKALEKQAKTSSETDDSPKSTTIPQECANENKLMFTDQVKKITFREGIENYTEKRPCDTDASDLCIASNTNMPPGEKNLSNFTQPSTLNVQKEARVVILTDHSKSVQSSAKKNLCNYCEKSFKAPSMLQRHIRSHTGERPYACQICGKSFRQLPHLQLHLKTHCTEEKNARRQKKDFLPNKGEEKSKKHRLKLAHGRLLPCHKCGRTFRQWAHWRVHKIMHTIQQRFSCKTCNMSFAYSYKLKLHLRASGKSHLQHNIKSHLQLQRSKDKELTKKEYAYTCENCGKLFKRRDQLQVHMRVHTGERPYSCGTCGKKFVQWSHLRSHERVHPGKTSYKCNVCSRSFAFSYLLHNHLKKAGEKHYSCLKCNRTFLKEKNLFNHKENHGKQRKRPYLCQMCQKAFQSQSTLSVHMRIHSQEKPFSCEKCGKAFRQIAHLNQHMNVHKQKGRSMDGNMELKKSLSAVQMINMGTTNCHVQNTEVQQTIAQFNKTKTLSTPSDKEIPEDQNKRNPKFTYACEFCGKVFKRGHHLKSHLRTHTFSYEHCNYVKGGGKEHQRQIRCNKALQEGNQSLCNTKSFQTEQMRRPYSCQKCPKAFSSPTGLSVHMRIHTRTAEEPVPKLLFYNNLVHTETLSIPALQIPIPNITSCIKGVAGAPEECKHKDDVFAGELETTTAAENLNMMPHTDSGLVKVESEVPIIQPEIYDPKDTLGILFQAESLQPESSVSVDIATGVSELQQQTEKEEYMVTSESEPVPRLLFARVSAEKVNETTGGTELEVFTEEVSGNMTSESTNILLSCSPTSKATGRVGVLASQTGDASQKSGAALVPNLPVVISGTDLNTVYSSSKTSTVCQDCNVNLTRKVKFGIKGKFPTLLTSYHCDKCCKVFGGYFQNSMTTQLSKNRKNICCLNCKKIFEMKSDVYKHILTHTGEVPYICQVCSKSYRQFNHLEAHIDLNHMQTYRFDTPTMVQLLCNKRYVCGYCKRCYNNKGDLMSHLLAHPEDNPYTCIDCNIWFSQESELKRHILTHQAYACLNCDVKFDTFNECQQHMKIHADVSSESTPHNPTYM